MKLVTIKKFSEISGYTAKAVYSKISRGDWLMDVHWQKAPDGRIFINLKAIERWITTNG